MGLEILLFWGVGFTGGESILRRRRMGSHIDI